MLVLLDSLEEYLLPLWRKALTQSKCIFRMTLSFSLCALIYLLTLPLYFSVSYPLFVIIFLTFRFVSVLGWILLDGYS